VVVPLGHCISFVACRGLCCYHLRRWTASYLTTINGHKLGNNARWLVGFSPQNSLVFNAQGSARLHFFKNSDKFYNRIHYTVNVNDVYKFGSCCTLNIASTLQMIMFFRETVIV